MLPTCLLPKVESLGADALIAVNNLAGGHRGNLAPED
jgi:nitronate monooxygenase